MDHTQADDDYAAALYYANQATELSRRIARAEFAMLVTLACAMGTALAILALYPYAGGIYVQLPFGHFFGFDWGATPFPLATLADLPDMSANWARMPLDVVRWILGGFFFDVT